MTRDHFFKHLSITVTHPVASSNTNERQDKKTKGEECGVFAIEARHKSKNTKTACCFIRYLLY
ncbi:hypothetical protein C1H71_00320 [Iodobacter fluviatilis]|jgi:hypothetical protein|uniref:Uncharacterized protein n=1 Tax=Iodobacter fluviatilis TaxID=537 RepID=A0A7G3G504_9NEIS|nr:hypothetical protein C1H71_00320 [Iodobacter fluviatilis]